ncbi:hypothetical protein F0U61_53900 [Archangium violaceum]|uniref:hypothetical protein n=1 Tax=Archangium violaceum TaxID=83451 RepID=UPI002B286206|nr:hypothetical protein F0U61_53900 [Archangium violaceum]
MVFLVDVDVLQVRGKEVSRTIYTFQDNGLFPTTMDSVLGQLGSTSVRRSYNTVMECQLLTELRALNAGEPGAIRRVLCVKDEALADFLYVDNREKVLEWLEGRKPMTTEPGTQLSVFTSPHLTPHPYHPPG